MQKDFQEFKEESKMMATEAKNSHQLLEKTPWLFILLGVGISAACTYYLGEQGLRRSDLYARLIGAENTALLVVGVMEGSLIALIYGMTTYLKSTGQRQLAQKGIAVLKVVLSLNVLAAFGLWWTESTQANGIVEVYAQWGTPLTICAALWFWPKILNLRHQDLQRAAVLENNAKMAAEWIKRHEQDQQNFLQAYSAVQDSPEMMAAQRAIAEHEAIQQLARERNIPIEAAVALFERAKRDKQQGIDRQFGVSVQPVKQIGLAPPPPVTASQPGLGSNFYDPNAPK